MKRTFCGHTLPGEQPEKENEMKNDETRPCAPFCGKIKGITCDVKGCEYNDGKNECTAGHISVGPTDACCSDETVCATFRPKSEG